MTTMEFFGCAFLAFGPPLALFTFTIAKYPVRIIILIASAFFWLVSLLLSSLLWYLLIPSHNRIGLGLIFSVIFQEVFRSLLYSLLRRAEGGLRRVSDEEIYISSNKHILAYVCGLGFGIMSGAFSLVNVLADSVGPATTDLQGGSENFLVVSAATSLCFILLHTMWGVIFFEGLDKRNRLYVAFVVISHMAVSALTYLNSLKLYGTSIVLAYVVLVVSTTLAFHVAGGTLQSLLKFILNQKPLPVATSTPIADD